MSKIITYLSLILLVTTISSCSWFKSKSSKYENSNQIPALSTPEGLRREGLGQRYPVPDNVASQPNYKPPQRQTASVPRPPNSASSTQRNQIKIQSLGNESWILATVPPNEVWPGVNYFLQSVSIPTINTDTQSGIIETGLVQFRDDPQLHQFLIVIEQGVQLYTSEISIFHRSFISEPRVIPRTWEKKSADLSREQWFRDALANNLATLINDSSVSLAGSQINAKSKVRIVTPQSSDPYLALDFPYDRAYASVAYSLQKGGFKITEEYKPEGRISVTFGSNETIKKSIWQRMVFWRSSKKPKPYTVIVRALGDVTEVRISDRRGRSFDHKLAEQLLTIIRSNLT